MILDHVVITSETTIDPKDIKRIVRVLESRYKNCGKVDTTVLHTTPKETHLIIKG